MSNVFRFYQAADFDNAYLTKEIDSVTSMWVSYDVWVESITLDPFAGAAFQMAIADSTDILADNWEAVGWLNSAAPLHWYTKFEITGSDTPPVVGQWYSVNLKTVIGSPMDTELWVDGELLDATPGAHNQTSPWVAVAFGAILGEGADYELFLANIRLGTSRGGADIFRADSLADFDDNVGSVTLIANPTGQEPPGHIYLCAPATDAMTATLTGLTASEMYLFTTQAGSAGAFSANDIGTSDSDGDCSLVNSGVLAASAEADQGLVIVWHAIDGAYYDPLAAARWEPGSAGVVPFPAEDTYWQYDGDVHLQCDWTSVVGRSYYIWVGQAYNGYTISDETPSPESTTSASAEMDFDVFDPGNYDDGQHLLAILYQVTPTVEVVDAVVFTIGETYEGTGYHGFENVAANGEGACTGGTAPLTLTLAYNGASVAGVTATSDEVDPVPDDWNTYLQNPNSVYGAEVAVAMVAGTAIMQINSVSAATAGFAADQDHQMWIQTSRVLEDGYWVTYGIARIDYGESGYITDVAEWNFDGVDSVSATFTAQAGWEYYLWTAVDSGPTSGDQIESTDPYPGAFSAGETTLSLTRVYPPDMTQTFYAILFGRPLGGHDLVIDTRIWGALEDDSGSGGNGFLPSNIDGGAEDMSPGTSGNPGGSGGGSNDGPFQGGDFGSGTGQQEDEEMALTLGSFRSRGARAIGLSLGDADDLDLLDDFTNEAVEQFLRLTKVHTRLAVLSVTAGEADYTLDTEIMSFTDAWYEPSGLEPVLLEITSGRKMQSMRMASNVTTDRPKYISLMGAHLLQFFPTPQSDDDLVHILYVPRPAAMSSTADTPSMTAFGGIPSEFHPTLEAYVKWKLGEFDESIGSKFGAVWKAQWDEGIGLARVSINRKSGVFRGRLTPGRNVPYLNASPGVDAG